MVDHIKLKSDYIKLYKHIDKIYSSYYSTQYLKNNQIVFDILLSLIGNNFIFSNKEELNNILYFLYIRSYTRYYDTDFPDNIMRNICMYFINNYLDKIDIEILWFMLQNKKLDIFNKYIEKKIK